MEACELLIRRRLLAFTLLACAPITGARGQDAIRLPAWIEPSAEEATLRTAAHEDAPSPDDTLPDRPSDLALLLTETPAPFTATEPQPIRSSAAHAARQLEHAATTATTSHALTRLLRRHAETRALVFADDREDLLGRVDRVASWAYGARGRIKAGKGKHDAAIADFRAAVTADQRNPAARIDLAVSLAEAGREDEALAEFDAAIELQPRSVVALRNRAALRLQQNQADGAIEDCDAALASLAQGAPGRAALLRLRGVALHSAGRLRAAAVDLNEALRLDPHDASAYVARGHVFAEGGYDEQAISDYRAALAADPRNGEAYRALAWVLATSADQSLRRPKTAVEAAKRSRRLLGEDDALALDATAAAHAAAGDFSAAVRYGRRALEAVDDDGAAGAARRLRLYQARRAFVAPVVR